MNEKIKEIAEFDGFKVVKQYPAGYGGGEPLVPLITEKMACKKYLTDLNALHRVALDVMDAMTELFNTTMDGDVFIPASDLEYNIKRACYIRPINGQYTYLVDAVYEAIVYLKKCEK